jgi:hypothetical protein
MIYTLVPNSQVHLIIRMMSKLFSKSRNIFDTLNWWEVIWRLLWWPSYYLNGLLFDSNLSLDVYRIDYIVTVGVLIVFNIVGRGSYQCGICLKPLFRLRGTHTIRLTEGTTCEVNIVFCTHYFLWPGSLRRAKLHHSCSIYIYYRMIALTLIFGVSKRLITIDLIIGCFFISRVSNFT